MNKPTIPGYIAVGVVIVTLAGYFLILSSLLYVIIFAGGGMASDLFTLTINSPMDFLHVIWLVAGLLFFFMVFMLLLFSIPYLTK